MARNDLILLDSVLNKSKEKYGEDYALSEQFELFSFDQILKDYDPSFEEIELGWVDGKDDGGIDGLYIFLDEALITEKPDPQCCRKEPRLEVYVITCKHKDSFKQEPINNLISSAPQIFDLGKGREEIISDFHEDVLNLRELFRDSYIELADKRPQLSIKYIYACRGDSQQIGKNIVNLANYLKDITSNLFSDIEVNFSFLGANELLELYRVKKTFSLRLKFIEANISRAKTNYIVLSTLTDFYHFITDDNARLRRHLFESNVRAYLGDIAVNQDIEKTLNSGENKDEFDFWWLNNGITILASSANIAGKELSLENIQIVNGLQTTETIYRYFSSVENIQDDRAVLIKIIVAEEPSVRDRIIKATNTQSPVDIASLRATDMIQRNIEHILEEYGWYYDRRKNFYKNQGKPSERIISASYLSSAIYAICLKDLESASRLRTRFMRDDQEYNKVFNPEWNIEVFASCIEISKKIEKKLLTFDFTGKRNLKRLRNKHRFLFAFIFVTQRLKSIYYHPNEICKLINEEITDDEINDIWGFIQNYESKYEANRGFARGAIRTLVKGKKIRRAKKNQNIYNVIKEELNRKLTMEVEE